MALDAAVRGVGHTSPNPAVGAVIVRDGQVLATGFHRFAGGPHAEIEALHALPSAEDARGATLYVTLEPCSTHGRTPPCVEAIVRAGIARVVMGTIDPNPQHAGRGAALLREAGVEVANGPLAEECAALNRPFNHWIVTRQPWVIAKAGMSLDGRLTRPPGEGQWLTSEAARAHAMQLRAHVDAILIGGGTLRSDNPRLTIRGVAGFEQKQPWRIIMSRSGALPENAYVFTDAHRDRTLVFKDRALPEVLAELGEREITSVLIEGGGVVLGEAFDARHVHEVHFYVAPLICGGRDVIGGRGAGATAESIALTGARYERIGEDLHVTGLCTGAPAYSAGGGSVL